jgi:hypothetical protein
MNWYEKRMTTSKIEVLFSEVQVDTLVEARYNEKLARDELRDALPNTVTINIDAAVKKLKEMEAEVGKKHGESVKSWRKAFKLYTDFISKNPGSKSVNDPGTQPAVPRSIEDIRAWIRSFEVLGDTKTLKLPRDQWVKIFRDASQAIADARAQRDMYFGLVSGASVNLVSNNNFQGQR